MKCILTKCFYINQQGQPFLILYACHSLYISTLSIGNLYSKPYISHQCHSKVRRTCDSHSVVDSSFSMLNALIKLETVIEEG